MTDIAQRQSTSDAGPYAMLLVAAPVGDRRLVLPHRQREILVRVGDAAEALHGNEAGHAFQFRAQVRRDAEILVDPPARRPHLEDDGDHDAAPRARRYCRSRRGARAAVFGNLMQLPYPTAEMWHERLKQPAAAGSVDLLLDIYQPEATCTAPRPTIFYVHGGGCILGDKQDSLVAAIAPRVTAAGFNFVSINYRLAGDNPVLSPAFAEVGQAYIDDGTIAPDAPLYVPIMASFEDGVTALNWMEDNAAQYCFDISRLGYWGSSAGTFVTLQIAYALDQFDIERPEPRFVNAWWGVLLRDADLEAGEAPFLILHGEQDPVVPYRDSEELAARAEDVGVPYAFYTLLGAGHGFDTGNEAQTLAGIELSVRFAVDHLTDATPTYGRFYVP